MVYPLPSGDVLFFPPLPGIPSEGLPFSNEPKYRQPGNPRPLKRVYGNILPLAISAPLPCQAFVIPEDMLDTLASNKKPSILKSNEYNPVLDIVVIVFVIL